MIRCLHVSNLALIREVALELQPGLNLLTGETGTGKSILVDALSFALGGRAGAELIRSGADRAAVQIEFEVGEGSAAAAFLAERGYPIEDGCVVARREVGIEGRSRAFLGSVMAPIADLKSLAALIVDLHAQHQHQSLLSPARHREILDRQADLQVELRAMAEAWREFDTARARLVSLRDGVQLVAQRIDTLRFQVNEIDAAAIGPDERATLRAERDLLRSADAIIRLSAGAFEVLYDGDGAALARIADGLRMVRELCRFDPDLQGDVERVEAARTEIEELARRMRDYPSRISSDPNRLQAVEDRLVLLEELQRKYAPNGDEPAILAHRDAAADELAQLTDGGETVADLETRVDRLRETARVRAVELSSRRRAAAVDLEGKVETELAAVAMKNTRFAVDFRLAADPGNGILIEGDEVAVDATGCDVVEFMLSANRGEALRPLATVASGGELSRIMLALDLVFRSTSEPRTLVFDEVDAGIGGAVAESVGRRLRDLSRRHQVICVTHLPQIASHADHHVVVAKKSAGGRTEVALRNLDEAGQVKELARMLAGERITPAALRHAAEMRARGAPR